MVFLILLGIVILYLGAEGLLRGSSSFASRLNINPLVIGLTIVAFSTSSPELFVSSQAALKGQGDLSLGTIIGSNIFTIGGILSFCALFSPIPLKKQLLKFDLPVMIFASCLIAVFSLLGKVSRWAGILFILLLAVYTIAVYLVPKRSSFIQEKEITEALGQPLKTIYLDFLYMIGGLLGLIFGSHFFINGTISLAQLLGISNATIGLTVVAIGTSLPEISCSLVALRRKKFDILVGNIVGSNIFNILCVIGVSSLIQPITVIDIGFLDLAMLLFTAIILFPITQPILSRKKAILIFSIYILYIIHAFF